MNGIERILDNTMCVLWMLTYTLVFIGTIKYKHPSISPITQAIIAPFEFSVLIMLLFRSQLRINIVLLSYIYWTFIEIAIIVLIIRGGYIRKEKVSQYLFLVAAITVVMCYLVVYKCHVFFFSYFNTFIGEIIWFFYILRKEYPMKPINLCAFFTKFIADAISIPVYFNSGIWISSVICVALPVLDFCFIIVYFVNKKSQKKNVFV